MAGGGEFRNIEARGENAIRITFSYCGKRRRETLKLAPTPKNLKYAASLLARIEREILLGAFKYADYFPDSAFVEKAQAARRYTFAELRDLYLSAVGHLAPSTVNGYRKAFKAFADLADTDAGTITTLDLERIINGKPWGSAKTRNNALTPLKQMFSRALRDGIVQVDPAAPLGMMPHQKKPPDPLTIEEAGRVLQWLTANRDPQVVNYFGFAIATGMRTSELIELHWPDIDFNDRTAYVHQARVLGKTKGTKTYQARTVELTAAAMQYLQAQKAHTFLHSAHVFHNPETGRPWNSEAKQGNHWRACLKALGMRGRAAYQTRHTFATTALMAGVNPAWISRQLGHKNSKMLYEVYSKWLDRADAGREVSKLDGVLGQILGQNGRK